MDLFFQEVDNLPKAARSGVWLREVEGQAMRIVEAELAPGNQVPSHQHEVEVLGWVREGSISLRIGEEARELTVGDMYLTPAGVAHSAEAGPQGVTVVEVFASGRIDPSSDVVGG